MASISSLTTNSTKGNTNSTAIGGLISGLDTDTLIEQMTVNLRSKIAQQQQKVTKYGWQQEAYRTVSSMLIEFAEKYTNVSSKTGMSMNTFWDSSITNAFGAFKNALSVSGTANKNADVSILGISALASKAKYSSGAKVNASPEFSSTANLGNIANAEVDVTNISGVLNLTYGDQTHYIQINSSKVYKDTVDEDGNPVTALEDLAKDLNASMKEKSTSSGDPLSNYVEVKVQDGKLVFAQKDGRTNKLEIGGEDGLMENLGFGGLTKNEDGKYAAGSDGSITTGVVDTTKFTKKENLLNVMEKSSMSFSYNGSVVQISFRDIKEAGITTNDDFKSYMQGKLDSAIGKNKVSIDVNSDGQMTFKNIGNSSVDFSFKYATGSLGDHFGIAEGASTRLNLSATVSNAGIGSYAGGFGSGVLKINGADIEVSEKDTISSIMGKINNSSEADVTVSYSAITGKFTFTSDSTGKSSEVRIEGALGEFLFDGSNTIEADGSSKYAGTDAVMMVSINGEAIEMTNDTNVFNIEGLTVTASSTFKAYTEDPNTGDITATEDTVTFSSSTDTDKMLSSIKSFIEDYNNIVKYVNDKLREKPDRNYTALSDAQKKDMSEDEIKSWEEKAKVGLLYNDDLMSRLSQDLRFVFSGSGLSAKDMEDMGITLSSSFSDNGKIVFNEEKMRQALETDPDKVKSLFRTTTTDTGATTKGAVDSLKTVMDKYAKNIGSTKGLLIQKAGHSSSSLSMLDNTIQKMITEAKDKIKTFETKLESEKTRLTKMFANLESVLANLNSQSSWLASSAG